MADPIKQSNEEATREPSWRPPAERASVSPEAQRWREENAATAKAWAEWVEKNGVPLKPLF